MNGLHLPLSDRVSAMVEASSGLKLDLFGLIVLGRMSLATTKTMQGYIL